MGINAADFVGSMGESSPTMAHGRYVEDLDRVEEAKGLGKGGFDG
jgi:hypothetical protein